MGCFNATDGFGGLPIRDNDEVYVLLIIENKKIGTTGFYDITEAYQPISFLIKGEYDSYGGLEIKDWKQESLKLLEEELFDLSKNGLLNLNSFDMIDLLHNVIPRGELYINQKQVGFSMFKASLFNSLKKSVLIIEDSLKKEMKKKESPQLDYFLSKFQKKQLKKSTNSFELALDFIYLSNILNNLRKCIMPQCGIGGQDYDMETFSCFATSILEEITNYKNNL